MNGEGSFAAVYMSHIGGMCRNVEEIWEGCLQIFINE